MPTYKITNKTSGADLGTYIATSEGDALDRMARDAGYSNHAEATRVAGTADLSVVEASEGPHPTEWNAWAYGETEDEPEWIGSAPTKQEAARLLSGRGQLQRGIGGEVVNL